MRGEEEEEEREREREGRKRKEREEVRRVLRDEGEVKHCEGERGR